MKTLKNAIIFLTVLSLLLLPGCSASEEPSVQEKAYPAGYAELEALIGKTQETVFAELALPEDLQPLNGATYQLPDAAEYAGVTFDVYLSFDPGSDYELFRITYQAVCQGNAEQAADNSLKVAASLANTYGKPRTGEKLKISEISKEDLTAQLSGNRDFLKKDDWDLTQSAGENVKAYLDKVGASEQWQQSASYQKLKSLPYYYLDFTVSFLPDENTTVIELKYNVSAYREHVVTK